MAEVIQVALAGGSSATEVARGGGGGKPPLIQTETIVLPSSIDKQLCHLGWEEEAVSDMGKSCEL